MLCRQVARLAVASLIVCGLAASTATARPVGHALLDVPYLAQPPELCGGAAASMVLRYWGESAALPDDFAGLVSDARGGIFTGDLTSAFTAREWRAFELPPATAASARERVRAELDLGRPLIALLEVGPLTYHYIVIVGSTDDSVVLHDPARAPYQVVAWDTFERAWSATDRWALLVLPPSVPLAPAATSVTASATIEPPAPSLCTGLVTHSIDVAAAGDVDAAERGLLAASRLCPGDAGPLRELAGLRFTQSRWADAATLARAALALEPTDAYTWHLLATSRYLDNDARGALDAWNRVGEPLVDVVSVTGSVRTWMPTIVRATGLRPHQPLTRAAFGRAERRLQAMPTVARAQLRFAPLPDGQARVDATIAERPLYPRGWPALATLGARALFVNEVSVDVSGVLSNGEQDSAMWRWRRGRPRISLGLSRPAPSGLPGTLTLVGMWQRESYVPSQPARIAAREERQRLSVRLADWATSWLRWQGGVAVDRWRQQDGLREPFSNRRTYVAADGALDVRLAGDRAALAATAALWSPVTSDSPFRTGGVLVGWRSTLEPTQPRWSLVAAVDAATGSAPRLVWPSAGTGQGRDGLLRAHPLFTDGVLDGAVFGRRVARGSLEGAWPVVRRPSGTLSLAAFVDTAKAWHRSDGDGTSRTFIDAGLGVRMHTPGATGVLRLDLARGLRGGGHRLSAGWDTSWPR